jgi:hypothetical protein
MIRMTMDPRRKSRETPLLPDLPAPAAKSGGRRAVMDDIRRRIERALAAADGAEQLAAAADAVLAAAEANPIGQDSTSLRALRDALVRYRRHQRDAVHSHGAGTVAKT